MDDAALKIPEALFDFSYILRVTKKFRTTAFRPELILGCFVHLTLLIDVT